MIKKDNTDKKKLQGNGRSQGNDPGDHGTFMMVDKTELDIDVGYQREANGIARIKRIAREFRWSSFSVLTVSERKEGFFVVDGGSRLRAVLLRDDIDEVPCLIFGMESRKAEATVFRGTNIERKNVTAYETHYAGLVSEDHISIESEKIVTKCGYRIVSSSAGSYEISAVATIRNLVGKNRATAFATILILTQVADGEPVGSYEMKGLFYLIETNKGTDFYDTPLDNMKEAGIKKIRTAIKHNILKRGKGRQSVLAEGMLDIINKNMDHDKVRVPAI